MSPCASDAACPCCRVHASCPSALSSPASQPPLARRPLILAVQFEQVERALPLEERKARLPISSHPAAAGSKLSEHIEADGETVFCHACKLGCEGIVSKQRGSSYRSGRVRTWIKTKNPDTPAITRVTACTTAKGRQRGGL